MLADTERTAKDSMGENIKPRGTPQGCLRVHLTITYCNGQREWELIHWDRSLNGSGAAHHSFSLPVDTEPIQHLYAQMLVKEILSFRFGVIATLLDNLNHVLEGICSGIIDSSWLQRAFCQMQVGIGSPKSFCSSPYSKRQSCH